MKNYKKNLEDAIKLYLDWLKNEKEEDADEEDIYIMLEHYLHELMEW